ncbi:Tyrosine recombinase XerC [Thiorhodovibrio winogradskyi]|uniref:Tyrosine recombinase XerC n=1 Tax=Thiorhodovibrio winogradskyi TaxID=77007 RepID=A0ABZ0SF85_9GAMM|nr:site-specific integrase [Thiorhodovibrio winogradskyi]
MKWKLAVHQEKHWDAPHERTFDEVILTYLTETAQCKRSAATDRHRAKALREHFRGTLMHSLNNQHLAQYAHARRAQGISNSTINREMALLSSAIGYCNRELDWQLPNPTAGRKLSEPEGRIRWLQQSEAEALIKAASHARRVPFLADLLTTALYTGCRKEELLGLEWSRVDLRERLIHLEARHTKAGKRRSIPLSSLAYKAILRRASFRSEHCPDAPWVFAFADGRRANDIRGAFAKACSDAGIDNFHFHDLRHTCAAWLVTAGAPLAEIRDLLGHSTIQMTERYAHLAPENLRTTVARFESRFSHADQVPQQEAV